MEKMEIKEYLQELLDKWNKYDELDGFTADSFRNDLEKLLEYWDLRIKEEPVRIFYAGDMCVGSSNKPKKQPEKQEEWREKIKQMVLTDCFKDQPDIQRYIDFIEQLLSEKTFSKEELEFLQCVLNDNETVRYYSNGGDGYIGEYIEPILEKISKLLEEDNE